MIKYCAKNQFDQTANCAKLADVIEYVQDRSPLLNQRHAFECTDRLTDTGRARRGHFKFVHTVQKRSLNCTMLSFAKTLPFMQ